LSSASDPEHVAHRRSKTTRDAAVQRADASCAGCHGVIGLRVDSAIEVRVGARFDGSYADSNELARALATSDTVRERLARDVRRDGWWGRHDIDVLR
jgi:hypothetical protein